MKTVDDLLKARAAEYFLGDTLQSLVKRDVHVGHHILLRDLLLLYQNHRLRLVASGPKPTSGPHNSPTDKKRRQYPPPPPKCNGPVLFEALRNLFSGFL